MVAVKLGYILGAAAAISGAVAQSTGLRYMPFGDSITEIICWRAKLWEKLQDTEWATVDWVGSGKTENNCGDNKYDRDNEGHSGFLAIDIANRKQLVGWLEKNPADVITMHLGTNDIVQQNKAVTDIIAAFTTLVEVMRASNPNMKIIVRLCRHLGYLCIHVVARALHTDGSNHLLFIGRSDHSYGTGKLQQQDSGSKRGHHPLGHGEEQHRVPYLGC